MAAQTTLNFSCLPTELQNYIFKLYLGNSIARLSYLLQVLSGSEKKHIRRLVRRAFKPSVLCKLYFNPGVSNALNLSTTLQGHEIMSISTIIQTSGATSGLTIAVERFCGDHAYWEEGKVVLRRTSRFGWMKLLKFRPRGNVWEFH